MPVLRTGDTQPRPLEVTTDAPRLPALTIVSPTPRAFTFPITHNLDLSDSPCFTPPNSPFEPELNSLAISSSSSCTTSPLMRTLFLTSSLTSVLPSPIWKTSYSLLDYIKRPENAFILFRRKLCEERQAAEEAAAVGMTKKQRQADLSKTISQQWKSLTPKERKYWEDLAKEKKEEHALKYPGYVYRLQRVRDKDRKARNKKRMAKDLSNIMPDPPDETHHSTAKIESSAVCDEIVATQVEDSSSSSLSSTTADIEIPRRRRLSKSVDAEVLERSQNSSPEDLPIKDPPHLFNSSENFSINGGHFNAIGGNMSSSTYNDESNTTMIFNQCIFSNDNLPNKAASSESHTSSNLFMNHPSSTPHFSDSPPISRTTFPRPKRRSRWSITTFIPVYYHYVQPVIMYPMHWISSYCVPMVASCFNYPPAPWGCWNYPG
ncbi:hypothetical protein GYMLUDRAFT_248699 [Collybiopsis luxurians FD-317 M1]|uniref:HMG box domain-containing protein n=1 Tax=Collybiopsis luxurians FD-317 M1 TaxID=944289 RepID=A0A0D0AXV8_9AGAR|nr:hypothetical protein GYMLUDRAFT_248699 [Collybiopsis luxurians FD-317 M1]